MKYTNSNNEANFDTYKLKDWNNKTSYKNWLEIAWRSLLYQMFTDVRFAIKFTIVWIHYQLVQHNLVKAIVLFLPKTFIM